MIKFMRFKILLSVLFLMAGMASADTGYSRLYVFGDSLSDTGNLASVIGDFPPPYFMNRVSNGPVAVEILAQQLGLSADASLHLIGVASGSNYAVAGARAWGSDAIDLDYQVNGFLANQAYVAPADGLYVIMIGGNDVRRARDSTVLDGRTLVAEAALRVRLAIETLAQAGARSFLVVNSPNIGRIPETGLLSQLNGNPGLARYATKLSKDYRLALHREMKTLKLPRDVMIREFDLFHFFDGLIRKADVFGFTNSDSACFSSVDFSFYPACDNGLNMDLFVFFDEIHPTARVHELVGQAFFHALQARGHSSVARWQ